MMGWRGYFGFCETPEVLIAMRTLATVVTVRSIWSNIPIRALYSNCGFRDETYREKHNRRKQEPHCHDARVIENKGGAPTPEQKWQRQWYTLVHSRLKAAKHRPLLHSCTSPTGSNTASERI
jgi:hypothetical protein